MDWFEEGEKAGKTEGWMNLEETLKEDLERHPRQAQDPVELVQTGIDGWEETDHFQLLYGNRMMEDAQDESTDDRDDYIEKYQENKDKFWEGYIAGRKSIGKDVYALARKLLARKSGGSRRAPTKASRKANTPASSLSGMR